MNPENTKSMATATAPATATAVNNKIASREEKTLNTYMNYILKAMQYSIRHQFIMPSFQRSFDLL